MLQLDQSLDGPAAVSSPSHDQGGLRQGLGITAGWDYLVAYSPLQQAGIDLWHIVLEALTAALCRGERETLVVLSH